MLQVSLILLSFYLLELNEYVLVVHGVHKKNLHVFGDAGVVGIALIPRPVIYQVQSEDCIWLYNVLTLRLCMIRWSVPENTPQSPAFEDYVDLEWFLSLTQQRVTTVHNFGLNYFAALFHNVLRD